MKHEKQIREEIIDIGRAVYHNGFLSGASGNISARLNEKHIIVTPSGVHKGRLAADDLILYDIHENKPAKPTAARPSSEIGMHTFIYRHRSNVHAVIHAHPPYTVALSVAGITLEDVVLPEAVLTVGTISHCSYATPTTQDVVEVMKDSILSGHHAIVLERHGSVTLGKTLEQAFVFLETMEHVAKVTTIANGVGKAIPLPEKEITRLKRLGPKE